MSIKNQLLGSYQNVSAWETIVVRKELKGKVQRGQINPECMGVSEESSSEVSPFQ